MTSFRILLMIALISAMPALALALVDASDFSVVNASTAFNMQSDSHMMASNVTTKSAQKLALGE